MEKSFTPQARTLWRAIPPHIQKELINNVWCPHCSAVTTMTDFSGCVEQGDLVLTGKCVTCGGSVARLIENA